MPRREGGDGVEEAGRRHRKAVAPPCQLVVDEPADEPGVVLEGCALFAGAPLARRRELRVEDVGQSSARGVFPFADVPVGVAAADALPELDVAHVRKRLVGEQPQGAGVAEHREAPVREPRQGFVGPGFDGRVVRGDEAAVGRVAERVAVRALRLDVLRCGEDHGAAGRVDRPVAAVDRLDVEKAGGRSADARLRTGGDKGREPRRFRRGAGHRRQGGWRRAGLDRDIRKNAAHLAVHVEGGPPWKRGTGGDGESLAEDRLAGRGVADPALHAIRRADELEVVFAAILPVGGLLAAQARGDVLLRAPDAVRHGLQLEAVPGAGVVGRLHDRELPVVVRRDVGVHAESGPVGIVAAIHGDASADRQRFGRRRRRGAKRGAECPAGAVRPRQEGMRVKVEVRLGGRGGHDGGNRERDCGEARRAARGRGRFFDGIHAFSPVSAPQS